MPGVLFCFFPAQREAQLIKEKLLEDQPPVRRRLKLIEHIHGHVGRREMNEANGIAARRKVVSREQRRHAKDRAELPARFCKAP